MKKTLLSTLLLISHLSANGLDYFSHKAYSEFKKKAISVASEYKDKYYKSETNSASNTKILEKAYTSHKLHFPIDKRVIFSNSECNQIINDELFTSCYDYEKKISRVIGYRVIGSQIKNEKHIKRRPRFYEDKRLPRRYRAYYKDYSHSSFDRGHSRSHASTNWNSRSVYDTYTMVNILPQTPTLNRKAWLKAEKYERYVSFALGYIDVLNIAVFNKHPRTIGKHHIAVPIGFYKVLYNEHEKYRKCYYYPNKFYTDQNRLKDFVIDCNNVNY